VNVLLLGSGGREHAFAYFIAQSKQLDKLFIAPGNAGTAQIGSNVNLNPLDFNAVWEFCIANSIELLVPGNEDPLVHGIVDFINGKCGDSNIKISVAGPDKFASQLEGSKSFAKEFMMQNNIPTASYKKFDIHNIEEIEPFLETLSAPYVLKADGLAAGKGVIITDNFDEALIVCREMISNKTFGEASSTVVVEEFLHGIEISVFVVSDGKDYHILGSAKDYKRILEDDQGPNTGGMGSVSPVPFADEEFIEKVKSQIIEPSLNGLSTAGHPYKGFMFLGLMNDAGNPKVIEYNVRMGDPETESIFPRLKTDMLDMLEGVANEKLGKVEFSLDERTAVCVFLVSEGYPGSVKKGIPISITWSTNNDDQFVFHAGTKKQDEQIVTNGGRVIAITTLADTLLEARENTYSAIEGIQFNGKNYRKDIGNDLIRFLK